MNKIVFLFAFVICVIGVLSSRNPEEWKLTRRALPNERVTFYVALKQRNVKQLEVIILFTL
jgi:hypothetical protein